MSEKMIEGLSEDVVEQILKISQEKQERDQLHRDNIVAKKQRDEDIKIFIDTFRELGQSDDDILDILVDDYQLSEKEAREYL